MELGEVEEGNHGVAVMLHVVIGVPQKLTNEGIRLDGASVAKHVGLVHLAVGVLGVADVVDGAVSDNDGDNPPEENGLKAFLGASKDCKDHYVDEKLDSRSLLEVLDVHGSVHVSLHAPSCARVVNGDTVGGTEDSHCPASKGEEDVKESLEVTVSAVGDTAELGVLQLLAREEAGKLGVLIDMVGVGVMLLVHESFVFGRFEANNSHGQHDPVVVLLGLPGVSVEEFVVSSKGEALKLESVEDVERNKDGEVVKGHLVLVVGKHVHSVDGVDRSSENREVLKEALEAFVV